MPSDRKTEVLILGYDRTRIPGGVTVVTDTLLQASPNARLHPIKHCYKPAIVDALLYLVSLARFVRILVSRRRKLLVHAIVASRGDRVRAVPIILACALLRVPLCIQYHKNVGALIFKLGSIRDRLLNYSYRACDLHVFLSPALRREFLKMAPKIGRTTVIHNALSKSWMGLRPMPRRERKNDLVFLGRWNAEKGIDVLLKYLQTTSAEIHSEIYSDHVPKEPIKNVVVKAWVNESEVRSVLASSRLVVLPSYAEAYPTVLLEALACGTPFVASDVGGIGDIASESGGGIVVAPGDASSLGAAIESLLSDEAAWSRHSTSGWQWVNRTCSIERVLPLWAEAYASIQRNPLALEGRR
jgi:glycosyltransferase involved in cell wall biosynthesis